MSMPLDGKFCSLQLLLCILGISRTQHFGEVYLFYHHKLGRRMFSGDHQLSHKEHNQNMFLPLLRFGWLCIDLGGSQYIVAFALLKLHLVWYQQLLCIHRTRRNYQRLSTFHGLHRHLSHKFYFFLMVGSSWGMPHKLHHHWEFNCFHIRVPRRRLHKCLWLFLVLCKLGSFGIYRCSEESNGRYRCQRSTRFLGQ